MNEKALQLIETTLKPMIEIQKKRHKQNGYVCNASIIITRKRIHRNQIRTLGGGGK
ncbi:hypothetical protein [Paenibacillus sp. SI8]|uniref:hypothetical protein n=1 Tax=Paenibacillus sp. SI8 TaxID=3163026 RepID=UPI0034672BB7